MHGARAMNTLEARLQLKDLAQQGLELTRQIVARNGVEPDVRVLLRSLALEAREALADAGYPGEATWRALQRASMGAETATGDLDLVFWMTLSDDFASAIEVLDSLLGPSRDRDSDVQIIG